MLMLILMFMQMLKMQLASNARKMHVRNPLAMMLIQALAHSEMQTKIKKAPGR